MVFVSLCRCAAFNSCTCLCGCTAWKHTHAHANANTHTTSRTGRGGRTLFSYKFLPFWVKAHIGDNSSKSNAKVSHMAHCNCCFVLLVYVLWRRFLTTVTSEQGFSNWSPGTQPILIRLQFHFHFFQKDKININKNTIII